MIASVSALTSAISYVATTKYLEGGRPEESQTSDTLKAEDPAGSPAAKDDSSVDVGVALPQPVRDISDRPKGYGASWVPDRIVLLWQRNIKWRFGLSSYFDDNIFIQHDNKKSDFVSCLGFGVRTGWGKVENPLSAIREQRGVPLLYEDPNSTEGNFFLADYMGGAVLYARNSGQDYYDQDALIRAGWTGTKLRLAFASRYRSLSTSDIDVGTLTHVTIFSNSLGAKYSFSGKTSFESTFSSAATSYRGFNSYTDWLNEDWMNYQISPKVNIGPGVGLGLTEIENGPQQTFERFEGRIVYDLSRKISLNARAGVEIRQLGGGHDTRQDPIFALGGSYMPFDGTSLTADVFRSMGISAVNGSQNYVQTGVDVGVHQRFVQKLHLNLSGGYENLHYLQTAAEPRDDNCLYAKVGIAFDITKWCNALVFYNWQKDNSTQETNSFVENRVGLEMNFAF